MCELVSMVSQVISAKKKVALPPVSSSSGTAGIRTKATAHMKYGMPEDLTDEWAGPAMVRVEERGAGLVEEVGAVLSGLTEFKTELLQLHAIVSHQTTCSVSYTMSHLLHTLCIIHYVTFAASYYVTIMVSTMWAGLQWAGLQWRLMVRLELSC